MSNDETQPVDQPVSGSRWEPAEQPPPAPVAYAPAPPPRQPGQNRGRLLLAGGAVGVALVAGAGGFALGHASADDDGRGGPGQFGRQGPGGFQGTFPGGGPQGTFPGQGQPPNGFPDPRGDDGDDEQLPDDGATPGFSTS
jgi:hypothetical protein